MALFDALWGAGLSALALLVGAALASFRTPSAVATSGLQHLAAGVVCGVVAAELVPELLEGGTVVPVATGFTLGVVLMLSAEPLSQRLFGRKGSVGFALATGLDIVIDGILIGFAFAMGTRVGVLLVVAFILELGALGLAIGTRTARRGRPPSALRRMGLPLALALPVIPAAALGGVLLQAVGPAGRMGLLSFATAVMLYLVVEELLKEAHAVKEKPTATVAFFVGFGALLLLQVLMRA